MQEWDSVQHKETVLLLAQRIAKLPGVQKKVLAMYYFENMQLSDIAACLGLSKIRTCQILVETSAQLLLVDFRRLRRSSVSLVTKNLITIAALAVTILAASAHAGEVIRSASATKTELTQYWSQHNNHGLQALNTTATTLHTLSGRPYAVFTVDAAEKITGIPVQLAMIYDVNAKVMYALLPDKANQFLKTGDRSLLKTALGSEAVDLS
jgi:sigma-70-like protein